MVFSSPVVRGIGAQISPDALRSMPVSKPSASTFTNQLTNKL